jgi:hypothetical protein
MEQKIGVWTPVRDSRPVTGHERPDRTVTVPAPPPRDVRAFTQLEALQRMEDCLCGMAGLG